MSSFVSQAGGAKKHRVLATAEAHAAAAMPGTAQDGRFRLQQLATEWEQQTSIADVQPRSECMNMFNMFRFPLNFPVPM